MTRNSALFALGGLAQETDNHEKLIPALEDDNNKGLQELVKAIRCPIVHDEIKINALFALGGLAQKTDNHEKLMPALDGEGLTALVKAIRSPDKKIQCSAIATLGFLDHQDIEEDNEVKSLSPIMKVLSVHNNSGLKELVKATHSLDEKITYEALTTLNCLAEKAANHGNLMKVLGDQSLTHLVNWIDSKKASYNPEIVDLANELKNVLRQKEKSGPARKKHGKRKTTDDATQPEKRQRNLTTEGEGPGPTTDSVPQQKELGSEAGHKRKERESSGEEKTLLVATRQRWKAGLWHHSHEPVHNGTPKARRGPG